MFISSTRRIVLIAFFVGVVSGSGYVYAAITTAGDLSPAYSGFGTVWNVGSALYVGYNGTGSLGINGNNRVNSASSYLGYALGAVGTVTVDGYSASFENSSSLVVGTQGTGTLIVQGGADVYGRESRVGDALTGVGSVTVDGAGSFFESLYLYVGNLGSGTLSVSNGGVVSASKDLWVGKTSGSVNNSITLQNGTINTNTLYASPGDLLGTGTINVDTLVSDIDLVFDANTGLQQQIILNSLPGQNITINIDAYHPYNPVSSLGAGYRGNGSLAIRDGVKVKSEYAYVGLHPGSSGVVTVSGTNSQWSIERALSRGGNLYVGYGGTGELDIEAGARVDSVDVTLGLEAGSVGSATVSGATWNNTAYFRVGSGGTGTLRVEQAGVVNSGTARFTGDDSTATVTGVGSLWDVDGDMFVGAQGDSALAIEDGGVVSVSGEMIVGSRSDGATGSVAFGNGSLYATSLFATPNQLTGSGAIHTTGLVSDIDLVFDDNHPLSQSIVLNDQPGQDITINLDVSSPENGGGLGAGYYGSGSIRIADGVSVTSGVGYLGYNEGAMGVGTISGPGASWNGGIYVGYYGDGELTIEDGGNYTGNINLAYWTNASGALRVTGAGSTVDGRVIVGLRDDGFMYIEDGGVVNGTRGVLGEGTYDATGTAIVTGPGSAWNVNGRLTIGSSGTGSLTIDKGGSVSCDYSAIGLYPNNSYSTTVVTGTGSRWDIASNLYVGEYGTGELEVLGGGMVNSVTAYIGFSNYDESPGTHGIGTVTVAGEGSVWNNAGGLDIGRLGEGTLNIQSGGYVRIGGDVTLGYYDDTFFNITAVGTVNLQGGTFELQGGRIVVGDGVAAFNFESGVLRGASRIELGQAFIQQGGVLAPGEAIGRLDIIGDYGLTGGAMELELGGETNVHDQLVATGDINIALLGTTLDLSGIGPMEAGTYTVIESTGGTLAGMFEHVAGIGMYPGLVDVSYTSNAVLITLNWDFVPGDLDGDGFVGIADLNIVLSNWNQDVTPYDLLSADVTGDGFVGIEDLNAVLGNWNAGTPPSAEALALVPEPAAVCWLGVGLLGVMKSRNRRKCGKQEI